MNRLLPTLGGPPPRPASSDEAARGAGPFTAGFSAHLLGQVGAPRDQSRAARAHEAYRRAAARSVAVSPGLGEWGA